MKPFTPTPWAWQNFGGWMLVREGHGSPCVLADQRDYDDHERIIKSSLAVRSPLTGTLVPFTPDHPDAAFLLRAVNAHEAMLAALKAADETLSMAIRMQLRECGWLDQSEVEGLIGRHVTVSAIRAAIALAQPVNSADRKKGLADE